ncbi:MAG: hemerythrin domain-containing protein [Polaromonas sp.]|nr:hemerythrin domain-containing protein [Polaromonas sp.]
MKRSHALRELSREHHEALVLARHACAVEPGSEAARAQREHLLARWSEQFEPHFAREELVLLPALEASDNAGPAALALAQHNDLRHLVIRLQRGDPQALAAWGDAMRVHVQFEERTLFPLAESVLDLTVLGDLMTR